MTAPERRAQTTGHRVEAIARWLYTGWGEDPIARPWVDGARGWQSSWLSSARQLEALTRGLDDNDDLARANCESHVETWVDGGHAEHGCPWCTIDRLQGVLDKTAIAAANRTLQAGIGNGWTR